MGSYWETRVIIATSDVQVWWQSVMSAGGHGPGHSMPALLQRAVVSTVSTLDIYTPQSHRTPGPDNTLPSPHRYEGQSDAVRLSGYRTTEVNCISTILLIRWKLLKQNYIYCLLHCEKHTEGITTTTTFDACLLFNVTLIWNRSEDKPVPWL